MNQQHFLALAKHFELGELEQFEPLNHVGQHIAWRLQTGAAHYFVKQIQIERYDQQANVELLDATEALANQYAQRYDWICPALLHKRHYVFEHQQQLYLVYPWLTASSVHADDISLKQAEKMGRCLAELHHTQFAEDSHLGKELILDANFLPRIESYHQLHKQQLTLLKQCDQQYRSAYAALDPHRVISHRDLHVDNVLWQSPGQPIIIDWESAGKIHPLVELFGLAINWAGITSEQFSQEKYQAVINAYQQQSGTQVVITSTIIAASLASWLAWVEYCLAQDKLAAAQQSIQVLLKVSDTYSFINIQ